MGRYERSSTPATHTRLSSAALSMFVETRETGKGEGGTRGRVTERATHSSCWEYMNVANVTVMVKGKGPRCREMAR